MDRAPREALRRVAHPERRPAAVFVNAMDTAPLAADPVAAVAGREEDLAWGVAAVAQLTKGPVYVASRPGNPLPVEAKGRVRPVAFSGPHPAGAVGLHIHRLAPVTRAREAWHLDAQDLAAIGSLFRSGAVDPFRVVALAGPPLARPRRMRAPIGADISALAAGDPGIAADEPASGLASSADAPKTHRVISARRSPARAATGEGAGFLGRYHRQVTVLAEDRRRRFLGWLAPGFDARSSSRAFAGALIPRAAWPLTTSANGSRRAIVPVASYERVMAFDIPPVFLLRALLMEDLERAEELGALELIEEDLGLLGFVCPAKNDYGPSLRRVLDALEKEG